MGLFISKVAKVGQSKYTL